MVQIKNMLLMSLMRTCKAKLIMMVPLPVSLMLLLINLRMVLPFPFLISMLLRVQIFVGFAIPLKVGTSWFDGKMDMSNGCL